MINRTIFLYANPDFDKRKNNGISKLYRIFVKKYGCILEIVDNNFIKNHCPDEQQVLIIAGGDGTIHRVVNNIPDKAFKNYIFGIIPSGTANELAKELDLPINIEKAAEIIISQKNISNQRIGLLNNKYKFLTGFLFGLSKYVLRQTPKKAKHYLGVFSFFFTFLKLCFKMLQTKCTMKECFALSFLGQNKFFFSTNYLLINNLSLKSKSIKGYKMEREINDKFTIVYIKQPVRFWDYIQLLFKHYSGKNILRDRRIYYKRVSDIRLEFNNSVEFLLDGELYKLRIPLYFSVFRNKMKIITR